MKDKPLVKWVDKTPPEKSLMKWVMRWYKFKPSQFCLEDQEALSIGDIDRACGDVVCPCCGLLYLDHPGIEGYENLVVTCDWRIYKL